MASGRGSRLRPFTTMFPKPLMPIGEVQILDLVLRQLHHSGLSKVTIATGHLDEFILMYLGDGSRYGVKLDFVQEREPRGTAGLLTLVPHGEGESLFVLNGDVLTTLDYVDPYSMLPSERCSSYGRSISTGDSDIDKSALTINEEGRIVKFTEKPTHHHLVAMGIYVFELPVLKYLSARVRIDVPDVIHALLVNGARVQSYEFDGYWLDKGQLRDCERALKEFEEQRSSLLHEGSEELRK